MNLTEVTGISVFIYNIPSLCSTKYILMRVIRNVKDKNIKSPITYNFKREYLAK